MSRLKLNIVMPDDVKANAAKNLSSMGVKQEDFIRLALMHVAAGNPIPFPVFDTGVKRGRPRTKQAEKAE